MAWGNAGSETLTSAGDLLDTGTITANKFIQFLATTHSINNFNNIIFF